MTETFFVTPNDESTLLWSGPRAGIDGAKELFGMKNTFDIKKLEEFIAELSKKKNIQVYIDYQPENSSLSSELYKKINSGNNRIKSLEPLTTKLRLIKCLEELELMKKSGEIAGESFKEVIKRYCCSLLIVFRPSFILERLGMKLNWLGSWISK